MRFPDNKQFTKSSRTAGATSVPYRKYSPSCWVMVRIIVGTKKSIFSRLYFHRIRVVRMTSFGVCTYLWWERLWPGISVLTGCP